jgi:hypothetical protein
MRVKVEIPNELLEILHNKGIQGRNATEFFELYLFNKLDFDSQFILEDAIQEVQELLNDKSVDNIIHRK